MGENAFKRKLLENALRAAIESGEPRGSRSSTNRDGTLVGFEAPCHQVHPERPSQSLGVRLALDVRRG